MTDNGDPPEKAPDKDAFFRVASMPDAWVRLASVMTAEELERAVRGALNVYIILENEFHRRFPAEWARYDATSDDV